MNNFNIYLIAFIRMYRVYKLVLFTNTNDISETGQVYFLTEYSTHKKCEVYCNNFLLLVNEVLQW